MTVRIGRGEGASERQVDRILQDRNAVVLPVGPELVEFLRRFRAQAQFALAAIALDGREDDEPKLSEAEGELAQD